MQLLFSTNDCLYILEFTVGYESNLQNNVERKKERYKDLVSWQRDHFKSAKFINLSISALGVFSKEFSTFIKMMSEVGLDKKQQNFCVNKIMSIAIKATLITLYNPARTSRKGNIIILRMFLLLPSGDPASCSCWLQFVSGSIHWRHDSILNFIANNLPSEQFQNIFVDIPGFSNPSIVTDD